MLLLSQLALAAEPVQPRPTLPEVPPVTEMDFETVELKGQLVGPELKPVFELRQGDFNPLIRLRRDWKLETLQSIDHIR